MGSMGETHDYVPYFRDNVNRQVKPEFREKAWAAAPAELAEEDGPEQGGGDSLDVEGEAAKEDDDPEDDIPIVEFAARRRAANQPALAPPPPAAPDVPKPSRREQAKSLQHMFDHRDYNPH